MRNKTPFISRSGQRAPYLVGFDWSCHWSPWASPASESHLERKLPWGRGWRCQHPAGKIVSPSELLRSMDSCEGRTKPGQILDSERWRHLLPGKDFCLQIVIYSPGGGRVSRKETFASVWKSLECHLGHEDFSLNPRDYWVTFIAQEHTHPVLLSFLSCAWKYSRPSFIIIYLE